MSGGPAIQTSGLSKAYGSGRPRHRGRHRRLADQQLRAARQWTELAQVPLAVYSYAGHDPLTQGVDVAGVIVLGAVTLVLVAAGVLGIERRDVRG